MGTAGFFIDLAVVDPERPGRYLLGIECDGATYHSARSARDRDRLRQQVLEGLGWRIHRIWSTDWFRNPEREIKRAVTAIEEARAYAPSDKAFAESAPIRPRQAATIERDDQAELTSQTSAIPAYAIARLAPIGGALELHKVPTATLASRVIEVVSIESPVHTSEVARRIADAAGVRRIGSRIQDALELAYGQATRSGKVRRQGEFLWLKGMQEPPLRDRSSLPPSSRRIDLVAPEEVASAVAKIVADAYGMDVELVPAAVCRLLGFGRMSEEMRGCVAGVVDQMVKRGRLTRQNGHVVVQAAAKQA